jgi:hypothetical protein
MTKRKEPKLKPCPFCGSNRADVVEWLRERANDPLEGGIPYTGWLREIADALEAEGAGGPDD